MSCILDVVHCQNFSRYPKSVASQCRSSALTQAPPRFAKSAKFVLESAAAAASGFSAESRRRRRSPSRRCRVRDAALRLLILGKLAIVKAFLYCFHYFLANIKKVQKRRAAEKENTATAEPTQRQPTPWKHVHHLPFRMMLLGPTPGRQDWPSIHFEVVGYKWCNSRWGKKETRKEAAAAKEAKVIYLQRS